MEMGYDLADTSREMGNDLYGSRRVPKKLCTMLVERLVAISVCNNSTIWMRAAGVSVSFRETFTLNDPTSFLK